MEVCAFAALMRGALRYHQSHLYNLDHQAAWTAEFSMIKPHRYAHTPLLVLAVALLTSCAPLSQYRDRYDLCVIQPEAGAGACDAHALQLFPAADGGH